MEWKDLCLKCLVYCPAIELVDRDGMGGLTAAMFLVCTDATSPVEGIQTFVRKFAEAKALPRLSCIVKNLVFWLYNFYDEKRY